VLVLHELFFPNALMRILAARRRGSTAARRDEVPPEPLLPS
jgi:hypothetical protein